MIMQSVNHIVGKQRADKAKTGVAIVEVLTGYGDIPHLYFLCEITISWKHQICNVVGCYGSRLLQVHTDYYKPNKITQ